MVVTAIDSLRPLDLVTNSFQLSSDSPEPILVAKPDRYYQSRSSAQPITPVSPPTRSAQNHPHSRHQSAPSPAPTPSPVGSPYTDNYHEHEAGPSHRHHAHAHAHAHAHLLDHWEIPPPPNPRRHRSGILMSRVRAASSGTAIKLSSNAGGSKSHGDLASIGMAFSATEALGASPGAGTIDLDEDGEDNDDGVMDGYEARRREWKRVVSEGHKSNVDEGEETVWDNSARYYHHLHSRPASRAASRSASPEHSPVPIHHSPSSQTSPIFVRRNLTLPQNGPGPPPPPPGAGASMSLSPSHQYLQTHLPPTFPSGGTSPETTCSDGHSHAAAMVFTPTTQEWNEIQATPEWREMRKMSGVDLEASFSGNSSEDEARRSSVGSESASERNFSASSSMLLRPDSTLSDHSHLHHPRPRTQRSVSVDIIGPEFDHTPDPGSPVRAPTLSPPQIIADCPGRPVFNPVIIAPSPILLGGDKVVTPLESPTKGAPILDASSAEPTTLADTSVNDNEKAIQDDDIEDSAVDMGENDSPVRFASFGRRDSLRAIKKAGPPPIGPRTKTKRELEREKLLKMVDEELEEDQRIGGIGNGDLGGGVQEIGRGMGLDSAPPTGEIKGESERMSKASTAEAVMAAPTVSTNPFEETFGQVKSISLPLAPKSIALSPTQPIKPSPLQASPVNAPGGLPTPPSAGTSPAETPRDVIDRDGITPSAITESPKPASGLDSIRKYARGLTGSRDRSAKLKEDSPPTAPRSPRRRDTNRVSLVAGRVVQPFAMPSINSLPPASRPGNHDKVPSLQSFSPFRSPSSRPSSGMAVPHFPRLDSTISIAPSVGAPSECGTPPSETAGGIGGRGIDDYVILSEAGKGAYGLVMRAKVKGPKGEPVGDEIIIKYIIKARILADCWKKHKVLGPIPVEIHVMDQLRHLLYNKPENMLPWDPSRPRSSTTPNLDRDASAPNTPESNRSNSSHSSFGLGSPTQKFIAAEIKTSPERGHPNICKLIDFFEDREFYYLVMPRFGTGLDLFDRVESSPSGLEPFEVRSLVGQLADAVRFLHVNGILHRDIKDENVILDGKGRCQLIDFGSAAHWRPGKKWDTFSGTLHYAAPEIMRGDPYGGKEQDVWALGVVAYVLLVGETPFSDVPDEVLNGLEEGTSAYKALYERCRNGHEEEGVEGDYGGRLGDAFDLVKRCMELEPNDRPSAEVIVDHRYLIGEGGWVGHRGWTKGNYKQ